MHMTRYMNTTSVLAIGYAGVLDQSENWEALIELLLDLLSYSEAGLPIPSPDQYTGRYQG